MHAPTTAYAVYLPRVSMNAAVYVNGLLVGSGGSFDEPVARNCGQPRDQRPRRIVTGEFAMNRQQGVLHQVVDLFERNLAPVVPQQP